LKAQDVVLTAGAEISKEAAPVLKEGIDTAAEIASDALDQLAPVAADTVGAVAPEAAKVVTEVSHQAQLVTDAVADAALKYAEVGAVAVEAGAKEASAQAHKVLQQASAAADAGMGVLTESAQKGIAAAPAAADAACRELLQSGAAPAAAVASEGLRGAAGVVREVGEAAPGKVEGLAQLARDEVDRGRGAAAVAAASAAGEVLGQELQEGIRKAGEVREGGGPPGGVCNIPFCKYAGLVSADGGESVSWAPPDSVECLRVIVLEVHLVSLCGAAASLNNVVCRHHSIWHVLHMDTHQCVSASICMRSVVA
jgi:hypothetical protein